MSSALPGLTSSSQCVVCFTSNRSSNVTIYKSIMQFRCNLRKSDKLKIHSPEKDQEKTCINRHTVLELLKRQAVHPSIREGCRTSDETQT